MWQKNLLFQKFKNSNCKKKKKQFMKKKTTLNGSYSMNNLTPWQPMRCTLGSVVQSCDVFVVEEKGCYFWESYRWFLGWWNAESHFFSSFNDLFDFHRLSPLGRFSLVVAMSVCCCPRGAKEVSGEQSRLPPWHQCP